MLFSNIIATVYIQKVQDYVSGLSPIDHSSFVSNPTHESYCLTLPSNKRLFLMLAPFQQGHNLLLRNVDWAKSHPQRATCTPNSCLKPCSSKPACHSHSTAVWPLSHPPTPPARLWITELGRGFDSVLWLEAYYLLRLHPTHSSFWERSYLYFPVTQVSTHENRNLRGPTVGLDKVHSDSRVKS